MGRKLVNLVDVSAHEVSDFPGQRNELFFFLSWKKCNQWLYFLAISATNILSMMWHGRKEGFSLEPKTMRTL
jgi:hypothetical protein